MLLPHSRKIAGYRLPTALKDGSKAEDEFRAVKAFGFRTGACVSVLELDTNLRVKDATYSCSNMEKVKLMTEAELCACWS